MIAASNREVGSYNNSSRIEVPGPRLPLLPPALAKGLSVEDMQRIGAVRPSFRRLAAGEPLYLQGDDYRSVYLLLEGWAFRYQGLEDGRRQILEFALPGSAFGLPGFDAASHGVEALTACSFSVFSRDSLCSLMQQIPALALRFVEALNGAQARTFEHLTSVGRRSARERVANLLLELVMQAQSGPRPDDGRRLAVPLMQAHIADALGLAPETVCRALTSMRKDGIVVLRAQRLEVLDIGRLAREAGMEIDRASTKRMGPAGYAARHAKTAAERVAA